MNDSGEGEEDAGGGAMSRMQAAAQDTMPMIRMATQLSVFGAYAGLSLYLLISLWVGGGTDSFVRRSYGQVLAAEFLSNPYYHSTGVMMQAPSPQHTKNYSSLQVASFPLPHANQSTDSAFIELPGGMQSIIDSSSMMWNPTMSTEAQQLPGSQDLMHMSMPLDLTEAFSGIQGLLVASMGSGGLPNVGRCSAGRTANDTLKILASTHRMGQCGLTGLQRTVDVSHPPATTISPFSTVHIPYLLLVTMWISSSFSLFVIAADGWTETAIYLTTVLWNGFLLVVSMIPAWYAHNHVPLNNIVLGVVALLATLALQWRWTQHEVVARKSSSSTQASRDAAGSGMVRAVRGGYGMLADRDDASGFRRRAPFKVSGFLDEIRGSVKLSAAPLTADGYVNNIKESMQLDQITVIETAITSPIFFTTVMAATSPSIPTWALQIVFLTILVSHLLFLPSRKVAQWRATTGAGEDGAYAIFLLVCAAMLAGSSVLLYAGGSVVFWDYADEAFNGSRGVGTPLQMGVIILYSLKTLYFVGIWVSMAASAGSLGSSSSAFAEDAMRRATARQGYINIALRVLNVLCKVIVGAIVGSLAINHNLPAYRESPWPDMLVSPM